MEEQLQEAVSNASSRDEICLAVAEIYRDLSEAIQIRQPICKTSGRCCRFEEFGHRLYVTTMELAAFVADLSVVSGQLSVAKSPSQRSLPVLPSNPGGCPFQVDGLCSAHAIRPFGCRIFFCDETSTDWQHEQYERLHSQLRRLHDEFGVPYFYVEWRFALRALGLLQP